MAQEKRDTNTPKFELPNEQKVELNSPSSVSIAQPPAQAIQLPSDDDIFSLLVPTHSNDQPKPETLQQTNSVNNNPRTPDQKLTPRTPSAPTKVNHPNQVSNSSTPRQPNFESEAVSNPAIASPQVRSLQLPPQPNPLNTEIRFLEKLVRKKLGLTDNVDEINPLIILKSYAYEKEWSSRRNHKELVISFLNKHDDDTTLQVIVTQLKQSLSRNPKFNPNGTLALILRYFEAKIAQEQALHNTEATVIDSSYLRSQTNAAIVEKLGLKQNNPTAKDLIAAYVTPTSFLKRFNNRHHAAMLNSIKFDNMTGKECYDAIIVELEKTGVEVNPQGTLVMLLNALKDMDNAKAMVNIPANEDRDEFSVNPS